MQLFEINLKISENKFYWGGNMVVLSLEGISHSNYEKTSDLKPFIGRMKAYKFGRFFLHYSLEDDWVDNFTGMLLCMIMLRYTKW